ncbi:phage late control protein GPD [compost metagenome]
MDALTLSPPGVPTAAFHLLYQQRDVTHDISRDLLGLTYTDTLTGRSDDLQIELMDPDAHWRGPWYPGHGDTLSLSIGWQGQAPRPLGRFEIDEVEVSLAPSVVNIRALGAGISLPIRTPEHRAYEATTLDAIARQIAQRLGLELTGKIAPIKLDRLTQQESDLEFLARLAEDYDYAFKVVGGRLVFHAIADLAKAEPVARFTLQQMAGFRFRDQLRQVPEKVKVKHHDPAQKKLVAYDLVNGETVAVPSSSSRATSSKDTAKHRRRSSSPEVAEARARADQARKNRERTTAEGTMMGRPGLVSGNVIALDDAGPIGGLYLIQSARHRFSRSGGYVVELVLCRVKAPAIGYSSPAPLALNSYGITDRGNTA